MQYLTQSNIFVEQVLDYDRFSRNDVVGSVKVPLHILCLDSPTSTEEVWGEIERERKPPEEIQEVLLSLSYLPSAERLTVQILEARNLFPPQVTNLIVRFSSDILIRSKRIKTRITHFIQYIIRRIFFEHSNQCFTIPITLLLKWSILVNNLVSHSFMIISLFIVFFNNCNFLIVKIL